jgi:hypothetical protein
MLWGVSFTDANTGTVVGDRGDGYGDMNGGTILRTTNGGATWTEQSSGTTCRLFGVSFTDANTGTAVGRSGAILRTTSGGVTWVEGDEPRNVPELYLLCQNYPNPFNPKTGIRYQVPGVSDVKLIVYDLLGREVAVLVNERKVPGTYEVAFDGNGLASGVYIYRLRAGSFVQSRTMLLLK